MLAISLARCRLCAGLLRSTTALRSHRIVEARQGYSSVDGVCGAIKGKIVLERKMVLKGKSRLLMATSCSLKVPHIGDRLRSELSALRSGLMLPWMSLSQKRDMFQSQPEVLIGSTMDLHEASNTLKDHEPCVIVGDCPTTSIDLTSARPNFELETFYSLVRKCKCDESTLFVSSVNGRVAGKKLWVKELDQFVPVVSTTGADMKMKAVHPSSMASSLPDARHSTDIPPRLRLVDISAEKWKTESGGLRWSKVFRTLLESEDSPQDRLVMVFPNTKSLEHELSRGLVTQLSALTDRSVVVIKDSDGLISQAGGVDRVIGNEFSVTVCTSDMAGELDRIFNEAKMKRSYVFFFAGPASIKLVKSIMSCGSARLISSLDVLIACAEEKTLYEKSLWNVEIYPVRTGGHDTDSSAAKSATRALVKVLSGIQVDPVISGFVSQLHPTEKDRLILKLVGDLEAGRIGRAGTVTRHISGDFATSTRSKLTGKKEYVCLMLLKKAQHHRGFPQSVASPAYTTPENVRRILNCSLQAAGVSKYVKSLKAPAISGVRLVSGKFVFDCHESVVGSVRSSKLLASGGYHVVVPASIPSVV